MKIGIIGAGNIGATLARKLADSGHEVKLANSKGPDTIRDLARDIGATAVSKEEAVQGVEAIVLAIPSYLHSANGREWAIGSGAVGFLIWAFRWIAAASMSHPDLRLCPQKGF